MEIETSNFLLASAVAYSQYASGIFNMFLTVLFSSFAFAAALPLRDIGSTKYFFSIRLSSSSIVMGGSLAVFYIISFISFHKASHHAQTMLQAITIPLPEDVMAIYHSNSSIIFGLGWPSIGFIVGAVCGYIVFMWVTNAQRPTRKERCE